MNELAAIVGNLRADLLELSLGGRRAKQAMLAAASVVVSVLIAGMAQLPDLWWAAISGFMSLQTSHPGSVRKSLLRLGGTAAGASLAVLLLPLLAYDQVALALTLWAFATLAILGFLVSPHGYAWLFMAITFILVVLLSVADPPTVLANAVTRAIEVIIGSAVAVTLSWTLAPRDPAPVAAAPGWSGLLDVRFPLVLFALRGGFAVMLMPLLWRTLHLPSLAQMPVTVAAVMAVPVAIADPQAREAVVLARARQRVVGCLLGGGLGLLCLGLSATVLLAWLALLASGIWLCAYLQGSARGIGYVGTQAAVAFILTLVQGTGPPTSILPGIDRFAGITTGLAVLLGLSRLLDFVFAASPPASPPASPSAAATAARPGQV